MANESSRSMNPSTRLRCSCAAFAVLSAACSDVGTRIFAVTVTEAETIDCVSTSNGWSNEKELKRLSFQTEENWKNFHILEPPKPRGARLHVITTEEQTQTWFEGYLAVGTGNITEGSPDQVFVGRPQPNY